MGHQHARRCVRLMGAAAARKYRHLESERNFLSLGISAGVSKIRNATFIDRSLDVYNVIYRYLSPRWPPMSRDTSRRCRSTNWKRVIRLGEGNIEVP